MSSKIDTVTQEIKKVEQTIFNVKKEIKSAKKKVANYKKNSRRDKSKQQQLVRENQELQAQLANSELQRDRVLAELNTLNAKIAAYKQFCEHLSNIETADKDALIKQAENLLFKSL